MSRRVPVLIAGGGPVGLCLALDLAWRGIESILLEKTDGVIHHPKTAALTYRTMEFCRRWGIAERIRHCGFPRDYGLSMVFATSMTGHPLTVLPYPSLDGEPFLHQTPERKQRAPQILFDPILVECVREYPEVDIRRHSELVAHRQDGTGVSATVRDPRTGAEETIEADYLVACDGAGSGIRRALGIEMRGTPALDYSVAIFVRIPGLRSRHGFGDAERYIFVGEKGTWGNLTVVDGDARWRLTVLGFRSRDEIEGIDASAWVRRCLGRDDIAFEIIDVQPWRRSRLVAERYAEGRVFLAGDSAHTMSPTGGFGFNTGLGDAVDLGWKLEGALRGWAGPALLASYDVERRPVGQRNVDAAAENYFKLVGAPDCSRILEEGATGDAERALIGRQMEAQTRTEWENLGVVLGYRYADSPVIVPDGTPEPADERSVYLPTARPGHRAPHAWLPDGRSTLDLYGRHFVLLRLDATVDAGPLEAAAAARGVPLERVDIDSPMVAALHERALVLVRPDGHVAWRGDGVPADPMAVIDRVRGALAANG